MLNCLANHGLIPRDGRDVRLRVLRAALRDVGSSYSLYVGFTKIAFLVHQRPEFAAETKKCGVFHQLWHLVCNPWATLFSRFGLRRSGQKDATGEDCIDLDQTAVHGAIEHDVSLSRLDYEQGDNTSRQCRLIEDLLASSSDGGETLSAEDLAAHRKSRIEQQRKDNPELTYGALEQLLGSGESALILDILGDGYRIRCDYVRAFFQEERLPVEEGWKARRLWKLGLLELIWDTLRIKRLIESKG